MKLVVAIVHADDAGGLEKALTRAGHGVTNLKSAGGFLRKQNATILVGVSEHEVEPVLQIVRERCHSRHEHLRPMPPMLEPGEMYMPYGMEVEIGGATVFVLDVDRFEKF